jgi:DNA polymerase-3 subunit delta
MPHLFVVNAAGPSQRRLLSELLDSFSAKGYETGRRIEADAEKSWQDLFAVQRTRTLFAVASVTVVESAENLGPFPGALEGFLEPDGADTVIVAVYSGDFKKYFSKEILSRLSLRESVEPPRWGEARRRWIEHIASEEKICLDREAGALLGEWFEDPEELRSEIRKLGIASGGAPVSGALVRALSVDEGHRALLDFLDGFCRKDRCAVLEALEALRRREEVLAVATAFYNRIRGAMYLSLMQGPLREEVVRALGLRPYQRKLAEEAASRYAPETLKHVVAQIAAFSCGEKWGRSAGWNDLELLVLGAMK